MSCARKISIQLYLNVSCLYHLTSLLLPRMVSRGRSEFSTACQVDARTSITFIEGRMKSEKLTVLQSGAALTDLKWRYLEE